MKERRQNLERHHILPRCIAKAFRLPKSVYEDKTNIEHIHKKEHDKRHEHTEEDLAKVRSLIKKGVIYKATIIPKERIKKKLNRSFEERQYDL